MRKSPCVARKASTDAPVLLRFEAAGAVDQRPPGRSNGGAFRAGQAGSAATGASPRDAAASADRAGAGSPRCSSTGHRSGCGRTRAGAPPRGDSTTVQSALSRSQFSANRARRAAAGSTATRGHHFRASGRSAWSCRRARHRGRGTDHPAGAGAGGGQDRCWGPARKTSRGGSSRVGPAGDAIAARRRDSRGSNPSGRSHTRPPRPPAAMRASGSVIRVLTRAKTRGGLVVPFHQADGGALPQRASQRWTSQSGWDQPRAGSSRLSRSTRRRAISRSRQSARRMALMKPASGSWAPPRRSRRPPRNPGCGPARTTDRGPDGAAPGPRALAAVTRPLKRSASQGGLPPDDAIHQFLAEATIRRGQADRAQFGIQQVLDEPLADSRSHKARQAISLGLNCRTGQ
jgi:hypothetical protein